MKKTIITSIISIMIVAGLVYAASSVQPSVGLYWTSNADPTVNPGVSAPLWQLLIRTDAPGIYYKSGSSNTAWTAIGGASAGATVTTTSPATGNGTAGSPISVQTFGAAQAGVVPASGGGTSNVLKADGSWGAAVAGALGVGFFGDGSDGNLTFDGSTTVLGMTPSGGVYHMSALGRNLYAGDITCTNGAKISTDGWLALSSGTTTNCEFDDNGTDGLTNGTPGTGATGNWLGAGGNGGAGAVNSGTATGGGNNPHAIHLFTQGKANTGCNAAGANGSTGQGGGGGDKSGGCAGDGGTVSWTTSNQGARDIMFDYQGHGIGDSASIGGGTGGGGGRGDGFTGTGGGGGGGGGFMVVGLKTIAGGITLKANGGAGAVGGVSPGSGGGGGGGGVAVLVTNSISGWTIQANGGAGGAAGGGFTGGSGGAGVTLCFTGKSTGGC